VKEDYRKAVRLADAAVRAEADERHDAARDLIVRISNECGAEGLYLALLRWCDIFADHVYDGPWTGRVNMQMLQVDSVTEGAHEAPSEAVWGGRLVAARAAHDGPAYDALIDEMPEVNGPYIAAVMKSTALTLTMTPRGYGRRQP